MANPVPAGPPVPYWPSVIVKPETVRGVGMYYVNLILDIIFGVFALVVGLSAVFVASATDPISAIGITAALGAASCGLIIVFVINFIMSLMSVLRMHHGSDEYGPEHAMNARRGVLFKWVGTSLSTLAAILVVYLLIAGSTAFAFGGPVPATVYVPLLITAFWTAGVTAKAQMYRFMVRSLQPPETRQWSDLASALIPALGIIGIAIVGYFTARVIDLISNPGPVTAIEASRLSEIMIGGVFLQWILGYSMTTAVMVGYISLFAVAVQTGIIMVIFIRAALDNRRDDQSYIDAVIDGSATRLRPKLMTVAAIVLSLLPVMFATGSGMEIMKPIAAPSIGGMVSSSLHVLFMTPCLFVISEDIRRWWRRRTAAGERLRVSA